MKLELRAITKQSRKRDSSVMMSSVMPSAKYSCSGSPLMLVNGSTAIDGLAAVEPAVAAGGRVVAVAPLSTTMAKARTGRAMFLTACSP